MVRNRIRLTRSLLVVLAIIVSSSTVAAEPSLPAIFSEMHKLEGDNDPKCYATATRLENLITGTPLSAEAQTAKIHLQKKMIRTVWRAAAHLEEERATEVSKESIEKITSKILSKRDLQADKLLLEFGNGALVTLDHTDYEHYSSIAYAYRAILAVEQSFLIGENKHYLPLSAEAIASIRDFIDLFTLATLQKIDQASRSAGTFSASAEMVNSAWHELLPKEVSVPLPPKRQQIKRAAPQRAPIIRTLIKQKLASYQAYNEISQKLFFRNLQVYFARAGWPIDPEESKELISVYTESMTYFVVDILLQAEKLALARKHPVIEFDDVHDAVHNFVPFSVDSYEDVTYFPRLARAQQVKLEAYDMDSFRDSGLHWRYLEFALDELGDKLSLELDPFAAEMIVESAAQFAVLVLRVAGTLSNSSGSKVLSKAFFEKAFASIQERVDQQNALPKSDQVRASLRSAPESLAESVSDIPFKDVTESLGVNFQHRSSDWLSRLLRSYLMKSSDTATLSIPPAFGGSGVAAEDINDDGLTDFLILSGSGNALYVNEGQGSFNKAELSEIQLKRPDGTYGEPRQPVIADFNNDGRQDILITYANDSHQILENTGNLKFTNHTATAGLGGKGLVGGPATVFDYDNDGLLDIYIGYFGNYPKGDLPNLSRRNLNGSPNKLFRNLGGFHFKDVTEGSGTDNSGWTQALSHTDFDLDGLQDLIVGNDFGINAYLRNVGQGRFEDVTSELGADKPSFTMNVGIADLNDDLHPDIYISNIVTMVKDEKYVMPTEDTKMRFNPEKLARMQVVEANDLFLSSTTNGTLTRYTLTNEAVERGFASTGWAWDADFFDFDNDGDEDLYCVNGMNEYAVYSDTPYYTSVFDTKAEITLPVHPKERNVFFLNQGAKLRERSKDSGLDLLENSRSAAYLDIDSDGDLDIVLNNYHAAAVVYENRSEELGNNWLKIKLIGNPEKGSNRDAIGAKLYLELEDKTRAWREVRGTTGYLSAHPKVQHFGLGKSESAALKIVWPNGEKQRVKHLKANQLHAIQQG